MKAVHYIPLLSLSFTTAYAIHSRLFDGDKNSFSLDLCNMNGNLLEADATAALVAPAADVHEREILFGKICDEVFFGKREHDALNGKHMKTFSSYETLVGFNL